MLVTAAEASIPILRSKIQELSRGPTFWILEGERLHPALVEEISGEGLAHGVMIIETDASQISNTLRQRLSEPIAEELVNRVAEVDCLLGSWFLHEAHRRGLNWVVMDRLVTQREETYRTLFFSAESAILRCLDSIRTGGFKTALVSNTDGSDVAGFWESPLGPCFDTAIFSHVLGDPKPSPTMFSAACEALCVQPSECLFVGDGGNNELSAAASLGITPLCAAWYLRRNVSELGPNIVSERSEGYPVLNQPSEIEDYLGMYK